MSRLTDRIRAHPAYIQLVAVRQRLAEIPQPSDPEFFESLERLRQVLERLDNLISDVDPALVSPDLLQVMAPTMTVLAAAVEQYAQTPDAPQLASVEVNLDALIAIVGWPLGYAFRKPSGMGQAVATYRNAVRSNLGSLHQQADQLTAQLAALQTEIEQASTTVATAASEGVAKADAGAAAAEARLTAASATADATLTAAITEAETRANALAVVTEERLATLATAVEAHKARLDTLTENYGTLFAAEQKVRDVNAAAALAEEASRHEAARAEAAEATQKALVGWSADAQATLDKLVAWEAEAERQGNELLGALSTRGMAGDYKRYADEQKRTADRLRWYALAVGAVAIGWSVWVALFSFGSAFEWVLLLKFLGAVPIAAIALYLGEQSGKHRDRERQSRQSELELAAIEPYLASLEPDQRRTIKAQLADRMFARQSTTEVPSKTLDRLFDLLEKMIKKQ